MPWGRDDELIAAQHLFVEGTITEPPASGIMLGLAGSLIALPDYRAGKSARWHQYVHAAALTLTVNRTDGSALFVTGAADFFLVRGDSAAIPPDLAAVRPDTATWYVEHWDDLSSGGATPADPVKTLPTHRVTWFGIKARYR